MRYFTDSKIRLGTAHAEYAQYWRDNSDRMPPAALRLSAGMLPVELFSKTSDPVFLHDARILAASVTGDQLKLKLHGDDNGRLRKTNILYDCKELEVPDIPAGLLCNQPYCDLMCHEFETQFDWFHHRMLFANGTELTIQFHSLATDHDAKSAP